MVIRQGYFMPPYMTYEGDDLEVGDDKEYEIEASYLINQGLHEWYSIDPDTIKETEIEFCWALRKWETDHIAIEEAWTYYHYPDEFFDYTEWYGYDSCYVDVRAFLADLEDDPISKWWLLDRSEWRQYKPPTEWEMWSWIDSQADQWDEVDEAIERSLPYKDRFHRFERRRRTEVKEITEERKLWYRHGLNQTPAAIEEALYSPNNIDREKVGLCSRQGTPPSWSVGGMGAGSGRACTRVAPLPSAGTRGTSRTAWWVITTRTGMMRVAVHKPSSSRRPTSPSS